MVKTVTQQGSDSDARIGGDHKKAARGDGQAGAGPGIAAVAIVDDDVELVKTYELLLNRRHIPIAFVAYDGYAAIELFRKADPCPAVAIIDNRMPFMNGIELMKEIVKIAPGVRFIFISADDSVRQEALNAGAARFLKKPIGIKEIVDSIRSLSNN